MSIDNTAMAVDKNATVHTRRRIVVGVDGSQSSIDALQWARQLSGAVDAEIEAVLSWHYPVNWGAGAALAEWNPSADAAQILATSIKAAFGDDVPPGLQTSVCEGHPAQMLLDRSVGAEMLVVGSRGHGGFVGLLIGSVSAYCAEHADCPVLVVHAKP